MTLLRPSHRSWVAPILLLGAVLLWGSGCADGTLNAPEVQGPADSTLFDSYVSLGNSITAGFQSGGIDSTTQSQSYAVLLAEQMNTPFGIPEFAGVGCPPPLSQFFNSDGIPAQDRPGDATDETCAFRDPQTPARVNNVAVPGARVVDAISNDRTVPPRSNPSPLTQFILGGRTQVEAALDANPTFATVWVGNNDVLGPALNGTADATTTPNFVSDYTTILDNLTSEPQFQGGVLVGVVNVAYIPFFSPGPAYAGLKQAGQLPPNLNVAANCSDQDPSTGLTARVPLPHGFSLIGQAQQNPGQTVTLDCQADPVLTPGEVSALTTQVRQYNAFIEEQAGQYGLAYLDPNDIFRTLYGDQGQTASPTDDPIPKFPDAGSDQPFGPFFSLDGIHPSADAHRLVADQLVQVIDSVYDTNLPRPENVPSLPDGGS